MEEKKAQAPKQKKTNVFKNLRAEFKKIIWPDRSTVGKETAAVIASSVLIAAVIALLDFVIQLALNLVI